MLAYNNRQIPSVTYNFVNHFVWCLKTYWIASRRTLGEILCHAWHLSLGDRDKYSKLASFQFPSESNPREVLMCRTVKPTHRFYLHFCDDEVGLRSVRRPQTQKLPCGGRGGGGRSVRRFPRICWCRQVVFAHTHVKKTHRILRDFSTLTIIVKSEEI